MDPNTQKQSIIDRLKQANNILVTVSKNPSVDQLAAAIGFTLGLNKLGKHAIAVFSGQAPSTIEFLKPEETFEKNTDSLRDFIISLDKAKADKLRYKVEDEMVKIFITPYRTSLTDKDLNFSQGDFNVEVVVALGVKDQKDLDDAITSQGRILHDATVIDINTGAPAQFGTLNWVQPKASSLCEMVLGIIEPMKTGVIDAQIATALLTGIVAETERFSNAKTTPIVMQISSKLMAAGANQQLVATELEPPAPPEPELPEPQPEPPPEPAAPTVTPTPAAAPAVESNDGSLQITHTDETPTEQPSEQPEESEDDDEQPVSKIVIDEQGLLTPEGQELPMPAPSESPVRGMTLAPPSRGGHLTANTETEQQDPSPDMLSGKAVPPTTPILSHNSLNVAPAPEEPPKDTQTLASIEEEVHSPHVEQRPEQPVEPAGPLPPPVPPPMMPPNL